MQSWFEKGALLHQVRNGKVMETMERSIGVKGRLTAWSRFTAPLLLRPKSAATPKVAPDALLPYTLENFDLKGYHYRGKGHI